jgi:hypothetical protein
MIHAALRCSNLEGTHTRQSNEGKDHADGGYNAQQSPDWAAHPRMNSVRSGNSCE